MGEAVTLFVPCLVDNVYPEIGISSTLLLEHAGFSVQYYPRATCCGQPGFNAGQTNEALKVARRFVDTLEADDAPLVCPSGSCTAMVRSFYPELFRDSKQVGAAAAVSGRVVEFSEFLVRAGALEHFGGEHSGRVAFHDSCHAFRELRVYDAPRALLHRVEGVEWVDVGEPACCGFGGLFSIKLPKTAASMAKSRLEPFVARGVKTLVSNDPGCILHLRKEAVALGYELQILHLAEFLARSMDLLPVGGFS
jgi:L-lactate dehydrogenase complex protein LldE